jgi:hypothetical protein
VGWETTGATVIIKGTSAVHKLLLTKVTELAVFHHVMSLKTSNGGECPAAAALGLIFYWCDDTIVSPVPICGKSLQNLLNVLGCFWSNSGRTILFSFKIEVIRKFLFCHVRELINALFPCVSRI